MYDLTLYECQRNNIYCHWSILTKSQSIKEIGVVIDKDLK